MSLLDSLLFDADPELSTSILIEHTNTSHLHLLTDMDFEALATQGSNGYRVLSSRKGWNN